MSRKFQGEKQWVRQILDKLTALEEHQIEPFNKDPQLPEWVNNLLLTVVGISYQGLKFKNIKNWKAKDLGKLLGRQFAGEHLSQGHVAVSPQVLAEGKVFAAWCEKWVENKLPGYDWKAFEERNKLRSEAWQKVFLKFLQEALGAACERPYHEARDFFEAFGKAVVMKPDEFETERTLSVGDKIRWVMIFLWRDIERLESVAQLHRVLERALKQRGIVVRYKRIERLCNRIKLKFKGPGRPAQSKTPTNP